MRFKSILQKCLATLLGTALAMSILIGVLFPSLFYAVMKPHFNNHVAGIINSSATKISYMLSHGNNFVHFAAYDDELLSIIRSFYGARRDKDQTARDISQYFRTRPSDSTLAEEFGVIQIEYSTMLITDRGDVFQGEQTKDLAETILQSGWYATFSETCTFVPPYEQGRETFFENYLQKTEGVGQFSPVFSVTRDGKPYEFICFAAAFELDGMACFPILITDFSLYKNQWAGLNKLALDDYMLLGSENRILYRNLGSDESKIDLERFDVPQTGLKQYEVITQEDQTGMNYAVLCSYPGENLRLAVHATRGELMGPYVHVSWLFVLLFFGVFLIFIIAVGWSLRRILGRLTKLSSEIRKVRGGDYSVKLDDQHEDEIGQLSRTFSMMIAHVQKHIETMLAHEKKEKKLQYDMVVSAIDPHFIYNTLNTASYLAEHGKNTEVVHVNSALISLLKDRLKTKTNHSFDTVRNEKKLLEQYLLIQNHLCHNQTVMTFQVDDKNIDLMIPKNILQPLVENSLLHGILLREEGTIRNGEIKIEVAKTGTGFVLRVEDNGVGMDEARIRKFFLSDTEQSPGGHIDSEHIGIYNIRSRLTYLFQDRYSISVDSKPGKGTVISVFLPDYYEH